MAEIPDSTKLMQSSFGRSSSTNPERSVPDVANHASPLSRIRSSYSQEDVLADVKKLVSTARKLNSARPDEKIGRGISVLDKCIERVLAAHAEEVKHTRPVRAEEAASSEVETPAYKFF
ncbi:hypothetical protein Lbir_2726 [Legionella birminghamensis]|uniref:Uncharacterized protein n=1 Tax=Legionella birminghamensis TaxID=28083 RepID=Q49JE8_9GAMM|nr:hypothetical protein [Legionella birminghamensis]AAX56128.1 unknown [Legionella birminghamensis]KTC68124.1 hypothetical protein Lbir_2726 [Legionella birminghamensis]STX31166.1 Uncharacterised protein [Legionella birminghamensis]